VARSTADASATALEPSELEHAARVIRESTGLVVKTFA
jgi:hypothetical protein